MMHFRLIGSTERATQEFELVAHILVGCSYVSGGIVSHCGGRVLSELPAKDKVTPPRRLTK